MKNFTMFSIACGLMMATHVGGMNAMRAVISVEETKRQNEALYKALIDHTTESGLDTVRLLLQRGASPNAQFAYGVTALHCAVLFDPKAVPILLEFGALPNVLDEEKATPLHGAVVRWCHQSDGLLAVKALIAAKAHVNCVNAGGQTPLDIANSYNEGGSSRAIIQALENAGGLSGKSIMETKLALLASVYSPNAKI